MEKAMNDRLAQFARVETPEVIQDPQVSLKPASDDPHPEVEDSGEQGLASFDDDIDVIRARRLNQLRRANAAQIKLRVLGHGTYTEIAEGEFLNAVIKSPRAIVHFYHNDFTRCKVMDKNLSLVAPSVVGCRFLKINAEKCPFFVEKLKVRVLPTLIYFIDGRTVSSVTGFEEFGGLDDFKISSFISSLRKQNMLLDSDESEYGKWEAKQEQKQREDISDSE